MQALTHIPVAIFVLLVSQRACLAEEPNWQLSTSVSTELSVNKMHQMQYLPEQIFKALIEYCTNPANDSFVGAHMNGADFAGAGLAGSNMSNVHAENANFDNSDLTDVTWTGADVKGATFTGATGNIPVSIREAIYESLS